MAKVTTQMRFGEQAVTLGYIAPRHVKKALDIQRFRRARGEPVPLMGEALVELGALDHDQAEEVFSELVRSSKNPPKKSSWFWRLIGRDN